jgi:hypothetical protein
LICSSESRANERSTRLSLGREMDVEACMSGQPAAHARHLVRVVVAEHEMEVELAGTLASIVSKNGEAPGCGVADDTRP